MLLPQSGAFSSLKVRLESVSSLGSLNAESDFASSSKPSRFFGSKKNYKVEKPRKETEQLNFSLMLDQFVQTQVRHQRHMQEEFKSHSLLKQVGSSRPK